MISYLTPAEQQRIHILDELLKDQSEAVNRFIDEEKIIEKLRGVNTEANPGPFMQLITNHNILFGKVSVQEVEIYNLKEDLKSLIKAVNTLSLPSPVAYSAELQTLKNKHSIY